MGHLEVSNDTLATCARFMMGYLGVTRKQKLCLAAAAGVSALAAWL